MNPFQTQYPLSPRKFWKKFLPTVIPTLIAGMVVGAVAGFALVLPAFSSSGGTGSVIAGFVGTMILIGLGVALLIFIWNIWYYKAYIRTYSYDGEDNFMTIKKGVFTPREIHVQYQKVQDVYVDQDLFDRIMGLYDVHIASATVASGMEAHIDGVDAATADGLKGFILAKIQGGGIQAAAMPAAQGYATPGAVPGPASVAPVAQFTGSVSSDSYPIQGRWLPSQFFTIAVTSIIVGAFFAGYFSIKEETLHVGTFFTFSHVFFVITPLWFIFHLIAQVIWKNNYSFVFLPEYIQFNTGILSRTERHLPYKSIQDVSVSQSIMDRIFGLANVVIENAAQVQVTRGKSANSNMKLVGLNPADAHTIVESLKDVMLTKNSSQMGL